MQPYQKDSAEVTKQLNVWPSKGLSSADVAQRQQEFGLNVLEATQKVSPFRLFLGQFKDVLIIILIVAAAVSIGLHYVGSEPESAAPEACVYVQSQESAPPPCSSGDTPQYACDKGISQAECEEAYTVSQSESSSLPTEGLLILAIVIAIAIVGFLNEYKAEKTVEALKKLVSQNAKVIRDGKTIEIAASELVPGDIVLLEEGQKVPADIRLLESNSLRVIEASLTGESQPVSKHTEAIEDEVGLGDQQNMVFSGTIISSGTAEGVVVGTGATTEIGKIAELVSDVDVEQTPMQKKLDALGKQLGIGVVIISVLVFGIIFLFSNENADAAFITRLVFAFTAAVALAVAAIPEGLAFVVRISLALGARRMATKNALVRKLSAVEALGSTDVICSDKTGTLTRGEMTVRSLWFDGEVYTVSGSGYDTEGQFTRGDKKVDASQLSPLLSVGMLNNNARLDPDKILGDPTEAALLVSAAKSGLDIEAELKRAPRVHEIPFDSGRKRMTTIHHIKQGYFVTMKGAAEVVLDHCSHVLIDGKKTKLSAAIRKDVEASQREMATGALRVLGFAFKQSRTKPKEAEAESELVFVGLQGMMDPPRTEVMEVIRRVTTEAGMHVIMITGDHAQTASAVAAEIGIEGETMTGMELEKLSDAEFEQRVENIAVYARVNPEHKIKIVKALKANGHQVAMTGDGVNDAPAIKAADIGVAMGINGTDAAKEASDMILLDDQFLTIINAIEEGRGIFDNVRKFVNYLLSANIAEVLAILFGVLIFQDLLLTAAQLLFINIVTDGLPAVALGSDPAEKGIMRFKPHRFQGSILNKRVWTEMFLFGLLMTVALLIHFGLVFDAADDSLAKSVAFAGMVVYEMVRLIDIRTDYHIKWFSNPWLSVAIVGSFVLLGLVMYVDAFAALFDLVHIRTLDWLIIAGISAVLFTLMKIANPILDRLMPDVPSV